MAFRMERVALSQSRNGAMMDLSSQRARIHTRRAEPTELREEIVTEMWLWVRNEDVVPRKITIEVLREDGSSANPISGSKVGWFLNRHIPWMWTRYDDMLLRSFFLMIPANSGMCCICAGRWLLKGQSVHAYTDKPECMAITGYGNQVRVEGGNDG